MSCQLGNQLDSVIQVIIDGIVLRSNFQFMNSCYFNDSQANNLIQGIVLMEGQR